MSEPTPIRIHADFNGLFKELLCLSHKETCIGADGQDIVIQEGMTVTAFEEDVDDNGNHDNLVHRAQWKRRPNGCAVTVHDGF